MYPVSDAFLQAVQENTRTYYWTGRITTTSGAVHEFGYTDIVKGSGYISRQCCGSTEIELGTVYSAEMRITLFTQIDRYTLEDAKVELFYPSSFSDFITRYTAVSSTNMRTEIAEYYALETDDGADYEPGRESAFAVRRG